MPVLPKMTRWFDLGAEPEDGEALTSIGLPQQ